MKTRIISSLIMLPLLVLVLLGGVPLYCAIAVISFIAMYEFYKGFESMDIHPVRIAGYVFGAILLAVVFIYLFRGADREQLATGLMVWLFLTVAVSLALSLFLKDCGIMDSVATITGVVYLPFFFVHVALIDGLPEHSNMKWLVFITAFCTDIFAYFAGMLFGKHKLCPDISPKKTIEGSIGGIAGSTCISAVFGALVYPQHVAGCVAIGVIGSVFAQCGDLIASSFKRKMGIKDYGNLIPGHGGILDRFDSVLLTAPLIYYYIVLFIDR